MTRWNHEKIRMTRVELGLSNASAAEKIREKTGRTMSINGVRSVEGTSHSKVGDLVMPHDAKVLQYLEGLDLDPNDFLKAPILIREPEFIDLRSNDPPPHNHDPRARGWRDSGALRIGVGRLDLEAADKVDVTIISVRLWTNILSMLAEEDQRKDIGLELEFWSEWQAGQAENPALDHDRWWLGVVQRRGRPANDRFSLDPKRIYEEATFKAIPQLSWTRFVERMIEAPFDLRFELRVRAQSAGMAKVHRLQSRFHLPAKDIQVAAKRGLKLERGFPAAIQLDVLQGW